MMRRLVTRLPDRPTRAVTARTRATATDHGSRKTRAGRLEAARKTTTAAIGTKRVEAPAIKTPSGADRSNPGSQTAKAADPDRKKQCAAHRGASIWRASVR